MGVLEWVAALGQPEFCLYTCPMPMSAGVGHDLPTRSLLADLGMGWGVSSLDAPQSGRVMACLFLMEASCHTSHSLETADSRVILDLSVRGQVSIPSTGQSGHPGACL